MVEQRERSCDSAEGDWGGWDMVDFSLTLCVCGVEGTERDHEARAKSADAPKALEALTVPVPTPENRDECLSGGEAYLHRHRRASCDSGTLLCTCVVLIAASRASTLLLQLELQL